MRAASSSAAAGRLAPAPKYRLVAELPDSRSGLGPATEAELPTDLPHVSLRGAFRDVERSPDFLVAQTLGNQLEHLALSLRQDARPLELWRRREPQADRLGKLVISRPLENRLQL